MFSEEYTFERLLQDALDNAPEGIDTRQGSIFYDAVSGVLMKVAKLYADIDMISEFIYIDSTTGEYLDRKAGEYLVTRLSATPARYSVLFGGVMPSIGERFCTDGLYFVLQQDENGAYFLEAEMPGTVANGVHSGVAAVPVNNIQGLTSSTFGTIMEYGTDTEDDESLRERLREKMSGPAENGNKQHYRTWCEEFDGVGRARIIPLWNGPNTVLAVLINAAGTPCSERIVREVQNYIDPADYGYTTTVDGRNYIVGDGLGEGMANLGAHFTAVAPDEYKIDISFNAALVQGASHDDTVIAVRTAIAKYLSELALNTPENEDVVVRVSAIGAIISNISAIVDYNSLLLNGNTSNVMPGNLSVAVMGDVTMNVL